MTGRVVRGAMIVAFSLAVGHLAWRALGPPRIPDYLVGGDVLALTAPDHAGKHLYLRRKLFLSMRPRHAWLQVLGYDGLQVRINGQLLASRSMPGFPVAIVVDATPSLRTGPNVIAIVAEQASVGQPPVVAVEG